MNFLTQQIGDDPLWQILLCVAFVVAFFGVSLTRMGAKSKDKADRRLYPNLSQVHTASMAQLEKWFFDLPSPKEQREIDVINLIIERLWAVTLEEAGETTARVRYETTAKCEAELVEY